MTKLISNDEVIRMVERAALACGSQKALAVAVGVTPSAINAIIKRRKPVPPAVQRYLGIKSVKPVKLFRLHQW